MEFSVENKSMYSKKKNFFFLLQNAEKKGKGRTGWPQHVWALELKSEQNLQS